MMNLRFFREVLIMGSARPTLIRVLNVLIVTDIGSRVAAAVIGFFDMSIEFSIDIWAEES